MHTNTEWDLNYFASNAIVISNVAISVESMHDSTQEQVRYFE
jgi:hypothetical protein